MNTYHRECPERIEAFLYLPVLHCEVSQSFVSKFVLAAFTCMFPQNFSLIPCFCHQFVNSFFPRQRTQSYNRESFSW